MLCTIRYIFHTIRYVSCTIRYVFTSIPESHASDALFMCSSAFQDLYHLWLLLIIVCVQNAKSSKHVIDIKLEINRKTLLSNFFRYILFVSYKFKQQHLPCNLLFIELNLVDIGVWSYQLNTNAFSYYALLS